MPFGATIKQFQDRVIQYLFEHEDRRIAGQIGLIAKDNDTLSCERGDGSFHGFIFDGVAYREQNPPTHYAILPGLDYSLNDRMELLLEQKKVLDTDIQLIRQTIFNLLNNADTDQQARDTLPDCLEAVISDFLSPVPDRMDPPGCTVSTLPRFKKQFEKTLPLIEQYAATKLIFS